MTRYQLAKLVQWAGELQTRKRLQKVVYLLQASGCRLDADFTLHHYGPYSNDVARLSDQMVAEDLLEEKPAANAVGQQFSYRLTDRAGQLLTEHEAGEKGKAMAAGLAPFEGTARQLLSVDLKELEVAATIVFFFRKTKEWQRAVDEACKFKDLRPGTSLVTRATELAQKYATA